MGGFSNALTGINAAGKNIEVISNNLANQSTTGFKGSRAEFAALTAGGGTNRPGMGVQMSRLGTDFTQGALEQTGNVLDLGINGNGFFVLSEPNSATNEYSRSGIFQMDADGNVVNNNGQRLQVYNYNSTISGFETSLSDLNVPVRQANPAATNNIGLDMNLDLDGGVFPATIPFIDSLGEEHTMNLTYTKTGVNSWQMDATMDNNPGIIASVPLTFDNAGQILPPTNTAIAIAHTNGAAAQNINLDMSQLTQYDNEFEIRDYDVDGAQVGSLTGMELNANGEVIAKYSNGQTDPIGRVALATFNNKGGLDQASSGNWVETLDSGVAQVAGAKSLGKGSISSGALEASNVDSTKELVSLITAQRNFQSNAQVITTESENSDTILRI